ncbi:MAG TPA: metal-dependent transcriptional regulator [Saprospiraceae bacterium]|nr:metal-dependent transcriptional regulator [Saprospiraceae bacterium]HMP24275.1 metal-dependent transcriptional regulator [Saprospiraceae bacterium]
MENISHTEENYLKAIFKIAEREEKAASTNAISAEMSTSAASVTDMLKRLSEKGLIHYEKYKGVTLTANGDKIARHLIRKHRLWEVFLVDKLDFSWDEVHDMAEQLEHIQAPELVERLDAFLGFPKFDPHGDPIPDAKGNFTFRKQSPLLEMSIGDQGVVVGVQDHSTAFLQYLDRLRLVLGAKVQLVEHFEYDESVKILLNGEQEQILSKKVAQNLFIQKS